MKKFLLIGAAALSLVSCSTPSDPMEKTDLIAVQLAGSKQWSMLNDKGEIVFEDEFTNRPTACYNGVFSVEEKDGYTVYKAGDKKPEVLGDLSDLKEVGCMEDGLIPVVFPNDYISVADKDGKRKFTLKSINGKEVVNAARSYTDGMLPVRTSDGLWGFVNKDGEMAVKPAYDAVGPYDDGLAVAALSKEDDNGATVRSFLVIDKKGESVLKLKEGYRPIMSYFYNGYLPVKNDDRVILINKKGEETKLPSKVDGITDYNDKYIIFSDGSDLGVINYEGEVLVRAKYAEMRFLDNDKFLARKSGGDVVQIIDAQGVKIGTLDYTRAQSVGRFGILVRDNRNYALVDKEGKSLCKEEFDNFNVSRVQYETSLSSDYFDVTDITRAILDPAFDFLKKHPFGTTAKVANGRQAKSSDNFNYTEIDRIKSMSYSATIYQMYNEQMAYYNYDASKYEWNNDAHLSTISITLSTSKEWGERGIKAVGKYLKEHGYGVTFVDGNEYAFSNSEIFIKVVNNSYGCTVNIDGGQSEGSEPQGITDEDQAELDEEVKSAPASASEVRPATGSSTPSVDYRSLVTSKKLTAADLAGYTKKQLRLVRNTIYAIHGRKFKSADLQAYFSNFSWYKPTRDEVPASEMSAIENANMALIAKLEK